MRTREDGGTIGRAGMSCSGERHCTRYLLMMLLALLAPICASAEWMQAISGDIWALQASAGETRWLVIHDRDSIATDGFFHIEVLTQAKGAEPWRFRHLAKHLAITEEALRASIVKPLKRGAVYPESFDDAYAQWKKAYAEGNAPICRSSVLTCLK